MGELSISIRQLLHYTQQEGGLSPLQFSTLRELSGTKAHQHYFGRLRRAFEQFQAGKRETSPYGALQIQEERSVEGRYEIEGFTLIVRGRLDLLLQREADELIIEVKSCAHPLEEGYQGELQHWQQVKLYAYLHHRAKLEALNDPAEQVSLRQQELPLALDYLSTHNLRCLHLEERASFVELEALFKDLCQRYLSFAQDYQQHLAKRDQDLAQLKFPYPELRSGQRELMQQVIRHLHSRSALLVQAPTGTGKTMATLYPALKALSKQFGKQVFYLTAKTSTRQVAEKALDDLLNQSDKRLCLRQISLCPKERLCLAPDLYCDVRLCPYANEYYKRLPEALSALLPQQVLNQEVLQEAGQKFGLCPFELSLDLALYCDVIIGDYNHAFDPRVRLDRFFMGKQQHHLLLIDEAHNLPDRLQQMYSAELTRAHLKAASEAFGALKQMPTPFLGAIDRHFAALSEALTQRENIWEGLDKESCDVVMAFPHARARKDVPRSLLKLLHAEVEALQQRLDDLDEPTHKRALLDYFFALRFFLRVAEEFYNEHYVCLFEQNPEGERMRLLCLNATHRLLPLYQHQHGIVFFSATLSPKAFFIEAFCGKLWDDQADYLELSSPFPPENRAYLVYQGLDTRFEARGQSLEHLVWLIGQCLERRPGRYLVFFPSYRYLKDAQSLIEERLAKQPIQLICQRKGMDAEERQNFLKTFEEEIVPNIGDWWLKSADSPADSLVSKCAESPSPIEEKTIDAQTTASGELENSKVSSVELSNLAEGDSEDIPSLPPDLAAKLGQLQALKAKREAEATQSTPAATLPSVSSLSPIESSKESTSFDDGKADYEKKTEAKSQASLLALAILGGIFGEGIDLEGEKLNGVIVVGVGLPQLSPERELIRHYYDAREDFGYQHAYQYPGFSKMMQAAGRLIRSEEDKGLVLLLDERYGRGDYQELFPESWGVKFFDSSERLLEAVEEAPDYN